MRQVYLLTIDQYLYMDSDINLRYINYKTKLAILSAIIFFVVTFLFGQVYPHHTDAAIHVLRSQWILEHGWFPYDEYAFDQKDFYVYPPVFHILGAVSKLIFDTYLVVPAAAGASSVLMTYVLVAIWYNRSIALATSIVLSLNPFFILWSARMYVGTTITAGFLLTMVLYSIYNKKKEKKYLYFAFLAGGSLSAVKTYGPAIVGIILFHYLWVHRESLTEAAKSITLPLASAIIVSLPWPIRNAILTGSPVPKVYGRPIETGVGGNPADSGGNGHEILSLLNEVHAFFLRALGVYPAPEFLMQLREIHILLLILSLVMPIIIIYIMMVGIRNNKINAIWWIWIGTFALLYTIQRVVGGSGFKYRHFITLTPVFCLMFVLGYRHISINYNLKRLLGLLLAGALLIQMGGVAAQQTVYYETAWDPATDWVEQNVEHDEVIYYHRTPRNFAIRVDSAYKFITTTEKEGYVHPSENFSEVISDRADYVIINDAALAGEKAKVKIASKSGVINKIKTIDIKQPIKIKDTTIYQVDRKWSIYKTKGTSN